MRRFDTPYLADWLATSLRWMVLVILLISLSLRGEMEGPSLGLLLVMLAWNALNSLLAVMNIRLKENHRQVVLAVDFLLAAAFFWYSFLWFHCRFSFSSFLFSAYLTVN